MKIISAIAKNTFRQAVRDKIFYGILIFALLFIGSSVILGSLSLGEDIFVIRNFGLAGIYIFGLILTVFLGASSLHEEIDKKITYILLSKPVTKTDIILGKFLGLVTAIGTTTILMFGAYIIIVALNGGGIDYTAFWVILLQIAETSLLTAILILFSVFTTPLAATIYTILIIYIGHTLSFILEYSPKSGIIFKYITLAVYYIFPNLEKFNIRNLAVHQVPLSADFILISLAYALIYISFAIYLAGSLFKRKEL